MTLEDLSQWSQMVAAVAVIVSLIILIVQNYQAGRFARETALRQQVAGLENISRALYETPGLADIWARGNADFDQLTNEERVRYIAYLTYTLRIWEGLHVTFMRGQIDAAHWRPHTQMLRSVQDMAGPARVWELRKHAFSENFQSFYESNRRQGLAQDIYALRVDDETS